MQALVLNSDLLLRSDFFVFVCLFVLFGCSHILFKCGQYQI